MSKINVAALCVCGEKVIGEDMFDLEEEIRVRLLYAIPHLLDDQDLECAVESIYRLIKPYYTGARQWRPSQGDTYFKIDSDGEVHKITWNEDDLDKKFWAFGNCFQTRAQAELARGKVKEVLVNLHREKIQ